jgi:hypothetical protein
LGHSLSDGGAIAEAASLSLFDLAYVSTYPLVEEGVVPHAVRGNQCEIRHRSAITRELASFYVKANCWKDLCGNEQRAFLA